MKKCHHYKLPSEKTLKNIKNYHKLNKILTKIGSSEAAEPPDSNSSRINIILFVSRYFGSYTYIKSMVFFYNELGRQEYFFFQKLQNSYFNFLISIGSTFNFDFVYFC